MEDVTVVIPTSPIRGHPSTKIIDTCIDDIRAHLPDSEIILMVDGIRPEQEYLREQYEEYTRRVLWNCLHKWTNVLPVVHKEHMHQSGMMRQAMTEIRTPLLLYVEHDTPLVPDKSIDWDACKKMIYDGKANTVRFHFEDIIPEPHKGLMIGKFGNFTKTIQWSQRPLLSSKVYFEYMMARSFNVPETSRCFIEDIWHGIVHNDYMENGMLGWHNHRLWIYTPKGGIKRSYNLDGRGDEKKYRQSFEVDE